MNSELVLKFGGAFLHALKPVGVNDGYGASLYYLGANCIVDDK